MPPLAPMLRQHVVPCAPPKPHLTAYIHTKLLIHCVTQDTIVHLRYPVCDRQSCRHLLSHEASMRVPSLLQHGGDAARRAGIFALSRHIHITKGTSGRCSLLIVASINYLLSSNRYRRIKHWDLISSNHLFKRVTRDWCSHLGGCTTTNAASNRRCGVSPGQSCQRYTIIIQLHL